MNAAPDETRERLRLADPDDPDAQLTAFIDHVSAPGLSLYEAQEQALLELAAGSNIIVSTPTGSGKSLIAAGALYFGMHQGGHSYYTAPIKALVSEKFFELTALFGAHRVGMVTGDAAINPQAPLICATAEILANVALREGAAARIPVVVMDEFHYYAEPDRGWAWQVPLLELPGTQFALLSATLGDVDFFVDDLRRRTGRDSVHIGGATRPVPLTFEYHLASVHEAVERLLDAGKAPIYVVHFTQAAAVEQAQALLSLNVVDKARKAAISAALGDFRFGTGFGKTLARLVKSGIGVHHAGMLPKYRRLVERLAQQGLLAVICGTDTLGVGINVPIRTVIFTGLSKYDGRRTRHLRVREFHQIAGRAGRKGFDDEGLVVVLAPEHETENAKALAKVATDPKKAKKIHKRRAPEGFVSWGEPTLARLRDGQPEKLTSHMALSDAMLLNLIAREGNCFDATRHLIETSHEPRPRQLALAKNAIARYRNLRTSGIVVPRDSPDASGRWVDITAELPDNFAMSRPLASFALAAIDLLDPQAAHFPLDVVSIIEATVEDPRQVLLAQQKAARDAAMAAMKADGVEYEERTERLAEITWPKPLAEMLEPAFATYRKTHPWAYGLSPKSVVREMREVGDTFNDYVQRYGLTRSEGVLLRYLTDVYRALDTSLPAELHPELTALTAWLGDMVRDIDSSLLDEWAELLG